MLLAEELYLLYTRDRGRRKTRKFRWYTYAGFGINAGLITELITCGAATLSQGKRPRLILNMDAEVAHPLLVNARSRLNRRVWTSRGIRLTKAIRTGLVSERELTDSLVSTGVSAYGSRQWLRCGKRRVHIVDKSVEALLRQQIKAILLRQCKAEGRILDVLQILCWTGEFTDTIAVNAPELGAAERKTILNELAPEASMGEALYKAIRRAEWERELENLDLHPRRWGAAVLFRAIFGAVVEAIKGVGNAIGAVLSGP